LCTDGHGTAPATGSKPATACHYDCPHDAQLVFIASTAYHTGSCCAR
jgi:hypothetical protein